MDKVVNKVDSFAPVKAQVKECTDSIFSLLSQIMKNWHREEIRYWINFIVKKQENCLASGKDFFNTDKKSVEFRQKTMNSVIEAVTETDGFLFDLIQLQYASPFGVFNILLNQNVPDITLSYFIIKVQYTSLIFENITVPEEIRPIFKYFLDNMINNQKYIKEIKLDRANAIIDTTFENFRLNIVHDSLNAFETPIVTIRKHITGVSPDRLKITDQTKYLKSLGQPDSVIKVLMENSNNSFCVFGEVGSGKTTLMRALIEHEFDKKRNVCVIEDSVELQIPTFLSFVTNIHYTIKDLFTSALRQNPSHIYIGETRTDEIVDIMEAGLTSSIGTTIHSNSFDKAIERIYFMSNSRNISKENILALIASSFKVFVHMDKRQIKGIWIRNDKVMKPDTSIFDLYDKITN